MRALTADGVRSPGISAQANVDGVIIDAREGVRSPGISAQANAARIDIGAALSHEPGPAALRKSSSKRTMSSSPRYSPP
jgi:hypothetical protein